MRKHTFFLFTTFFFNIFFVNAQCPTADAGPDVIQCSGPNFTMNGSVSNTPSYYWTSLGGGIFNPNNTPLNATYSLPSSTEGHSTIVLTATKGGCPDVKDTE